MSTALIYVRQSKTGPGAKALDDQEKACRRIEEVAACEYIEVYRDEDISGATDDREDFQRFLRRIEESKPGSEVAVVTAYDLSRIGRDEGILFRHASSGQATSKRHGACMGEHLDSTTLHRRVAPIERRVHADA